MTNRRAFLTTLGAVGAVGAVAPRLGLRAAEADPILAHITGEFARTQADIKRLNYVRADHARTLASTLRLLALHSKATLHLDESIARKVRGRKGTPPPTMDHERQRRELQQRGIDADSIPMRHVDQDMWDQFISDTEAGVTVTARLNKVAANLDALATRLARSEAMNNPAGARIVLAQEDAYCAIMVWNVRAMDTFAAIACGLVVVPELCATALIMASAIWATAWFAGCV